ncbi:hypothetical protein D1007_52327 [Hordeum vulgare]|nr:hypothetical protein D1007_52327 [Hordeum vulgare]
MDMTDLNLTPPQEEDGLPQNQEEDRLIVMDMADLNLTPPQEEDGLPQNQEEDRLIVMDMADLNLTPPQEEDGLPQNQEEDHQEGDAAGEGMFFDLNFSPPRDHEEAIREEASIPEEAAVPEEEAIAQEGAIRRSAVNLTNQQRFGVYFALRVIKSRDGDICPDDKLLVTTLLNTTVRTVERIWSDANRQIAEGLQVDVSNKKGRSGRKRKDLDLSRTSTIPLNKRRTIRALARSLSVPRSTLHRRFQMDELKRVTNTVKPTLKPENKIRRLKFCISMLDELWISTSRPLFKPMTNIVHIDEKCEVHMKEKKVTCRREGSRGTHLGPAGLAEGAEGVGERGGVLPASAAAARQDVEQRHPPAPRRTRHAGGPSPAPSSSTTSSSPACWCRCRCRLRTPTPPAGAALPPSLEFSWRRKVADARSVDSSPAWNKRFHF